MNANVKKLKTEFGPETRFQVNPVPAAPFRAWQQNEFEMLKDLLLTEQLSEVWDADLNSVVRRAANEASALAWTTGFPLLVFPALFEEKTVAALAQAERQAQVRRVTRDLLAV